MLLISRVIIPSHPWFGNPWCMALWGRWIPWWPYYFSHRLWLNKWGFWLYKHRKLLVLIRLVTCLTPSFDFHKRVFLPSSPQQPSSILWPYNTRKSPKNPTRNEQMPTSETRHTNKSLIKSQISYAFQVIPFFGEAVGAAAPHVMRWGSGRAWVSPPRTSYRVFPTCTGLILHHWWNTRHELIQGGRLLVPSQLPQHTDDLGKSSTRVRLNLQKWIGLLLCSSCCLLCGQAGLGGVEGSVEFIFLHVLRKKCDNQVFEIKRDSMVGACNSSKYVWCRGASRSVEG